MGCSRPGALGVCASLSLFLPYWSKLTVRTTARADEQLELELTLGLWGSCLATRSSSGNATTNADVTSLHYTRLTQSTTSFTCASYFDTTIVRLQCTSDLSGDYACERILHNANTTLCASSDLLALLRTFNNNNNNNNASATIDINRSVAIEWQSVVEHACGRYGVASNALAVATAVLLGLASVLLVCGVTCGAIASCTARVGSAAAAAAAVAQAALAVVWHVEASAANNAAFGTSYYLSSSSVALLAIAFVAGRTHVTLGRDAQKLLEIDFVMMAIRDEQPLSVDSDNNAAVSAKTAVGPLPTQLVAAAAADALLV